VIPTTVLQVKHPQSWKEDVEFVSRVKNVWKDNRLWYGTRHNENGEKVGFWGELKDLHDPNKTTFCFLGRTKRQVIPYMNTSLRLLSWNTADQ